MCRIEVPFLKNFEYNAKSKHMSEREIENIQREHHRRSQGRNGGDDRRLGI